MNATGDQPVLIQEQGVQLTLTLSRPEVGNAFSADMVDTLWRTFTGLAEREDIRVVVLAGLGKHFCSGLDLKDGGWGLTERAAKPLLGIQRRISRLYLAMRRCPQAIIARVQGAAYGGGLSLAEVAGLHLAALVMVTLPRYRADLERVARDIQPGLRSAGVLRP